VHLIITLDFCTTKLNNTNEYAKKKNFNHGGEYWFWQHHRPQGKRPLRTVVDKMMTGTTEIINDTSSKVQAGLLQNFGLSELNMNNSAIINH
jgi:hypothetical protein